MVHLSASLFLFKLNLNKEQSYKIISIAALRNHGFRKNILSEKTSWILLSRVCFSSYMRASAQSLKNMTFIIFFITFI